MSKQSERLVWSCRLWINPEIDSDYIGDSFYYGKEINKNTKFTEWHRTKILNESEDRLGSGPIDFHRAA